MAEAQARSRRVRGGVEGAGFRPFVFQLAHENALAGWVLNEKEGVQIHVTEAEPGLAAFNAGRGSAGPFGSRNSIAGYPHSTAGRSCRFPDSPLRAAGTAGSGDFARSTGVRRRSTVLFDPVDRRCGYPYFNRTKCAPRYRVLVKLSYDLPNTTVTEWPMDSYCAAEDSKVADHRFHEQPVACPSCGPDGLHIWSSHSAPPNDGGISLDNVALAAAGCSHA
jgi:hydrogenase maturation protein HypF